MTFYGFRQTPGIPSGASNNQSADLWPTAGGRVNEAGVMVPSNAPKAVQEEARTIDARIAELKASVKKAGPVASDGASDAASDGGGAGRTGLPADALEPAQPAAAATTSDEKVAALERQVADLKKALDQANGRYGGATQTFKAQIADLNAKLAEAQSRLESAEAKVAEAQSPAPGAKPWLNGIEQSQIDRLGEDFFELAWKVNQPAFSQLKAELAALKKGDSTKAAQDRLHEIEAEIRAQRFWLEVDRLSPGASATNGDPADTSKPAADGWGTFLDMPTRDGGLLTFRDEAQRAVHTGDARAFASIHDTFQRLKKKPNRPAGARGDVVPLSSVGSVPPDEAGAPRRIKQSEVIAWQQRCAKARPGEIPLDEVDRKTKEFQDAYREGRMLMGV